jgi:hypothetical protein
VTVRSRRSGRAGRKRMEMKYAWIGASLAFAAALAACSGNIGGGTSGLPSTGASPLSQIAAAIPTSSPVSASNIASVGEGNTAPQPLPTVAGYGGTITFTKPVPSTETPNPKAKATATPSSGPLAVGVTAAIVEPTDAPKFNPVTESRRHKIIGNHKEDPTAPKALLYITLLATGDVTFDAYPRIAIDVPRDVVTKYRDGTFGLALYDPADKSKLYRLSVAERDTSTPAPGSVKVTAPTATTATPSPSPTPTRNPSASPGPSAAPTTPTPAPAPTLPPERVAFNGTATTLFLKANRPVVFALYAVPQPATPKPEASGSPGAKSTGSPSPKSTGSPAASAVPSSASSSAPSSPVPSPAGS